MKYITAPHLTGRVGFGAMQLSDETTAEPAAVLAAALANGATLIDTANVYAPDAKSLHHNESMVATAVEALPQEARERVIIATKVGLARKGPRWLPDGDPKSIARSVNKSLKALRTDSIDLLQLHVRDPRVPFEDSLGALATLFKAGKVRGLGLCNTTFGNVATALNVLPAGSLVSVQNALSPMNAPDAHEAAALLPLARALGLSFIVHSPFGGRKKSGGLGAQKAIARIHAALVAEDAGAPDAYAMVLAWLTGLAPEIVAIPGATRVATAEASARALAYPWPESVRTALDKAFPTFAALRDAPLPYAFTDLAEARTLATPVAPNADGAGPHDGPEVILTVGIQGAGKSSAIQPFLDAGYLRLNRDDRGGKLNDLIAPLTEHLAAPGSRGAILDNTYATASARAPVIAAARAAGVTVRAIWLDTPLGEARINVIQRMLDLTGQLCGPDALKSLGKVHANLIPPAAQQTFLGLFEPPTRLEGFNSIERRPFVRKPASGKVKGLLLDVDGTLRLTASGEKYPKAVDDFVIQPGRTEVLRRWVADGWQLFFVSNQSGIASGKVSEEVVQAAMENTAKALDIPVKAIIFCPHPAFPVGCFCRKPLPGMGVRLMRDHDLDPTRLVMVGDMNSDAEFAQAIGARYFDAEAFFGADTPDPTTL